MPYGGIEVQVISGNREVISGAQVYLDGELIGETPLRKKDILPGEYALKVYKDGFRSFEARVSIEERILLEVKGTLIEVRILTIKFIGHDVTAPLVARDTIEVILIGDSGNTAVFDVGDVKKNLPMQEISPGRYVGIYRVGEKDQFSDLAIIERRLDKIEVSLKSAASERTVFTREKDILLGLKGELEKDRPIRELHPEAGVARTIGNYQLLTAKPLLIIINIGEDQLPQAASLEADVNSHYPGNKCRAIALCGKLEMELAQLEDNAAGEFRAEFGLGVSGLENVIKKSYELSDLISFFTKASNEVRAWSVKKGTPALKAAGKIHTDMEKGFIRAEGVNFENLVKCGSLAEARKQGQLRLEGKDYVIQDGDIITFLFNV